MENGLVFERLGKSENRALFNPKLLVARERYVSFYEQLIFKMSDREHQIERNSGWGNLKVLKALFNSGYTQTEIDIALGNALAYSKIEIAKYLILLGADISYQDYDGVYYSVHNNEVDGLKFALSLGIDVNLKNGILLNTAIFTAYNAKDVSIVKILLENGADINLITENTLQVVEKFGAPELKEIIKNDT